MTLMRLLPRLAIAVIAVLVALVLLVGGEDPYVAELRMQNAGGLKDGSPVTVGGVKIGKVDMDVDPKAGEAVARLEIEPRYAPIGKDARAVIAAQNLLGQKSVRIEPGDATDPAPSGVVIREDRITEATDLDRVLSVLDADTRTRLAIFVNEAGTAFTGRRADFNRFLRDIGPAFGSATELLDALGTENERLGRLVATTDRYVDEVTRRRDDVIRVVDRVGQAATTVSARRAELRSTLATAPGALDRLQRFLRELESTAAPLGAAARRVSAAAPPLRTALDELEPFRRAADPALRTAVKVAPDLEELADEATPVLRAARPAAAALRATSGEELPGVSRIVDRSINNALAVVENWTGAIQFRDGLSHIFRGEASIAPDALASVVERLAPSPVRRAKRRRAGGGDQPATPAAPAPAGRPAPRVPQIELPGLPKLGVPQLDESVRDAVDGVQGALDGVTGKLGGRTEQTDPTSALLDFLLGS